MEVARALEQPWEDLDRAHADACRADLARMEAAVRLEDEQGIDDPEIPDISCFIASRCGVSTFTAMEWLRVGRALRELPRIRAAYAGGLLSWDKVRILTRFVDPALDAEWALRAPGMKLGRLWNEQRRHSRQEREEAGRDDHAERYLRTYWDDEGRFLHLEAQLASEQGAAVEKALKRAAEKVAPAEEGAHDRKGARMADALEALATQSSGGKSAQPVMVVHVDAATLVGIERPGSFAETEDGVQLASEAVQRLACHARIRWVKTEDGAPVEIGRAGRKMGGALEDLVKFRDRVCRAPGCDRGWSVEAHHIVPHSRGGPTTLRNMALLCGTHHRMLHTCGWQIRGDPAGELTFLDRKGRVIGTSVGGMPGPR